jgi:hypothetical protein
MIGFQKTIFALIGLFSTIFILMALAARRSSGCESFCLVNPLFSFIYNSTCARLVGIFELMAT